MEYIIDRFEGNYGVCQDEEGKVVDIPRQALPKNAKEGSRIGYTGEEYELLPDTEEAEKIKKVFDALFDK